MLQVPSLSEYAFLQHSGVLTIPCIPQIPKASNNILTTSSGWGQVPPITLYKLLPAENTLKLAPQTLDSNMQVSVIPIATGTGDNQHQTTKESSSLLPSHTLLEAAELFLSSRENLNTKRTYKYAFNLFWSQNFLDPRMTLEEFSSCRLEGILDRIRGQVQRSDGVPAKEAHKQARAAVFASFTEFIERQYARKNFRRVLLNKYCGNKTFAYKRHESSATILTDQQLVGFFTALKGKNFKGYLFALIQFHGARRVGEVARIKIHDICWTSNSIFFSPSKTGKVAKKRIAIQFPLGFISCLKLYVFRERKPARSSDFLFDDNNDPIKTSTITSYYRSAWGVAEPGWFPDSITHCIRATFIALNLRFGKTYEEILRVTGHSDYRMIGYYGEKGQVTNITNSVASFRIFNMLFSL